MLGIAGQCQHAVSDRVARRLVAGHHQQDEERRDLPRRQPLAVDLGFDQAAGQIVVVVDPAVFGQRGGVGADVRRNLHELVEIGGQIGIAEAENDVGPVKMR